MNYTYESSFFEDKTGKMNREEIYSTLFNRDKFSPFERKLLNNQDAGCKKVHVSKVVCSESSLTVDMPSIERTVLDITVFLQSRVNVPEYDMLESYYPWCGDEYGMYRLKIDTEQG